MVNSYGQTADATEENGKTVNKKEKEITQQVLDKKSLENGKMANV